MIREEKSIIEIMEHPPNIRFTLKLRCQSIYGNNSFLSQIIDFDRTRKGISKEMKTETLAYANLFIPRLNFLNIQFFSCSRDGFVTHICLSQTHKKSKCNHSSDSLWIIWNTINQRNNKWSLSLLFGCRSFKIGHDNDNTKNYVFFSFISTYQYSRHSYANIIVEQSIEYW